jgi:hypothetical protein
VPEGHEDTGANEASAQEDESAGSAASAASAASAEADPRPVFEGDWSSASGREKGLHGQRVKEWLQRHPEHRKPVDEVFRPRSADTEVAAILGSGAAKARHASVGAAQILDDIARDSGQPGSARVSAARALVEEEREQERQAAAAARSAATAALASLPMPDRLQLLERVVRRDEPAGWVSIFPQAADPAAPAAQEDE